MHQKQKNIHILKTKTSYIIITFIAVICFSNTFGQGFSTKGTDFWFGFMENYLGEDTSGLDQMKVYITSDNFTASGTVSVPLAGWSQNFTVLPNSTVEITIPTALVMCLTTETVEGKGVHVTTDNPVTVYQLNYVPYTSDANIIIPTLSLGKKYFVTTYSSSPATTIWTEVSVSELMVVGVYDNTVIKITPKCNTEGMHGAGVPFSITLNQGEVYQVKAYFSSSYNLTGTLIELDTTVTDNCKTFAVFSGNKCTFVPGDSCCCNHICEQMMPVNTWGKKYITVPLEDRASDVFRIVASQNGTIFTIDGGAPQGLNAGSYYEADLSSPSYIVANKPISVTQFSKSANTDQNFYSDPFMIVLNPLEQTIDRIVFNSFVTPIISDYWLNMVTKTADTGLVHLDGASVSSAFLPVLANPVYSYAQLSVSQGNHVLETDSGLIANVYGYGWYETYGYIAGATVKNLEMYFSISTPTNTYYFYNFTDTICKGTPLTFTALASPTITDYYWNFGDGSPILYGQSVSHTYNNPGKFLVTYYYQRNNICGLDSILWEINVKCCNPEPLINASTPICVGNNSTISDISVFNPNANYTWDFDGGTIISGSGQGPYQVTWSDTGSYTIWVVVSEPGCSSDSISYIITVKPIPTSEFVLISPICYGETTIINYTGNASPTAIYQWDFNGGNLISGAGPGPLYVNWFSSDTFNIQLVVTENGCSSLSTMVPIIVFPPPTPNFSANPQTTFIELPLIYFYDHSMNTVTWEWSFGDISSGVNNFSSDQNPFHSYSDAGEYTVWLIATSPDGCIDSFALNVQILEITSLFVPNAFTPNNDGINDIFEPFSTDIDYTLSIYDRWGERLFEAQNQGWDGYFKGEELKSDVYIWCLLYSQKNLQQKMAIGRVTLLR